MAIKSNHPAAIAANKAQNDLDQAYDKHCSELRFKRDKLLDAWERAIAPANIRPAVASDIVVGAVIWHDFEIEYEDDEDEKENFTPLHHTIDEVLYPDDDFKAYYWDGCRYGLNDAFVECD